MITTTITGDKGKYDKRSKRLDDSVRYGRNAAHDFIHYTKNHSIRENDIFMAVTNMHPREFTKIDAEANARRYYLAKTKSSKEHLDFILESQAPSDKPNVGFIYKYMPEEKAGPNNLNKMALLGAAFEELGKKVSVSVTELTTKLQTVFGSDVSAEALDINKDKMIDIGEFSTSILVADMLSSNTIDLEEKDITGQINRIGQVQSLAYLSTKNLQESSKTLRSIYSHFSLEQAVKEYSADSNNLV